MPVVSSIRRRYQGFTIVELVVIITVIAILATIATVAYGGIQKNATAVVTKQNLKSVAQAMQLEAVLSGETGVIPDSVNLSKGVSVQIVAPSVETVSLYKDLSAVQNGVLFHKICSDLLAEGYGKGTNNGGQLEQYVTACNVYNAPQLEVNSWTSRVFNVPIKDNTLSDLANSIHYNDSWRPGRDQVEKDFYNTWNQRFIDLGGTYPVTTFWDPWANQWSGIPHEDLPAMVEQSSGSASTSETCLEAYNERYPDDYYHMNGFDAQIESGRCEGSS